MGFGTEQCTWHYCSGHQPQQHRAMHRSFRVPRYGNYSKVFLLYSDRRKSASGRRKRALVSVKMETQKPVSVEVLTYAPTLFFHCQHCEVVWQEAGVGEKFRREQIASALPDDLKEEYQQLSDWVRETIEAYGERIAFRVIDVASIEGVWKSVRYGIHKYPAIVVERKDKIVGHDFDRASDLIRRRLAELK